MKKTVTTILSLALALILVSSLSSGVILAKGPSDNASDRGKERARYHTERDVAFLDCGFKPDFGMSFFVTGFHSTPEGDVLGIVVLDTTCVEGTTILLSNKYKMQDGAGGTDMFNNAGTRYMFLRIRKVRND